MSRLRLWCDRQAPKLRWLQCPGAAPPASFYFQELVDSDVEVTNMRGIYNQVPAWAGLRPLE